MMKKDHFKRNVLPWSQFSFETNISEFACILNLTLTFTIRIILNEEFPMNIEVRIKEDIC